MPTDAPACAEPGTVRASPSLAFLMLLPCVCALLLGFAGIYVSIKRKETGPLCAALKAKDEDAAEALLDGGADPNEVNQNGMDALHMAAREGCRLPLFHRILGMIHNVNASDNFFRTTALMWAAAKNHLDIVIALMNHPRIDLNVQDRYNNTALHFALYHKRPAILAQLLSDDRIDSSLKNHRNETPMKHAIAYRSRTRKLQKLREACTKILREHGAPEE